MDNFNLPTNDINNDENELLNPSFLNNTPNNVEVPKEPMVTKPVVVEQTTTSSNVPNLDNFEVSKQEVNVIPDIQAPVEAPTPVAQSPAATTEPVVAPVAQAPVASTEPTGQAPAKTAISQLLDAEADEKLTDDEELLIAFIGPNAESILGGKFNIGALIFNVAYFFYRKMLFKGCFFYVLQVAILIGLATFIKNTSLLLIFALGLDVLLSFLANTNYIDFAQKKIDKIKAKYPNASLEELKDVCKKEGGPSILWVIIGGLVLGGITTVITTILSIIGLGALINEYINMEGMFSTGNYETSITIDNTNINTDANTNTNQDTTNTNPDNDFDGSMAFDSSFALNMKKYIDFTVPSGYKNIALGEYEYSSEKSVFNTCTLSINAVTNYRDAKKLITQMKDKYKGTDVEELSQAGVTWYKTTDEVARYNIVYAANYKDKLLVVKMEIESDAPKDKCTKDIDSFFKSLTAK